MADHKPHNISIMIRTPVFKYCVTFVEINVFPVIIGTDSQLFYPA